MCVSCEINSKQVPQQAAPFFILMTKRGVHELLDSVCLLLLKGTQLVLLPSVLLPSCLLFFILLTIFSM